MPHIIFPCHKDEDFTAWNHALAQANGMEFSWFVEQYYHYDQNYRRTESHMANIDHVCHINRKYGFPSAEEVLCHHTSIMAESLYKSSYIHSKTIDAALYHPSVIDKTRYLRRERFKYCPLCAKEDLSLYGRVIAHAPHQMFRVASCYKHHVLLSADPYSEEIMPASEEQDKDAVFSHKLFKNPLNAGIRDISAHLQKSWKMSPDKNKILQYTGCLSEEKIIECLRLQTRPSDLIKRLLLSLVRDPEELVPFQDEPDIYLQKAIQSLQRFDPDLEILRIRFPFLRITCGKCGHAYTIHYL